jgi:ATP-dependent helicase HrpB
VETLRRLDSEYAWPNLSDDRLLNELDHWLAPWLDGITSLKALGRLDMHKVLAALLDWQQTQLLDALAPEVYITPAGSKRRIAYAADKPPVLAVALQEMFGTETGPSIAAGQLNVVIHLLSPAGRPLQITQDLKHFWLHGYKEVRKEMRGRYTKHSWPEDPVSEKPHCGVKR